MNTTIQPNTPTAATPPVRTEAQNARSFALDKTQATVLDLARILRDACAADMKKPLGQRDRAQLEKTVNAKLDLARFHLRRVME